MQPSLAPPLPPCLCFPLQSPLSQPETAPLAGLAVPLKLLGRGTSCPWPWVHSLVWFGMGVPGTARLVCPLGLCVCHRTGWGMEDGRDLGILDQDCLYLLRGLDRLPRSPTSHCPFGAWRGAQRGESGQLLATLSWIDSVPIRSKGGLGASGGTVGRNTFFGRHLPHPLQSQEFSPSLLLSLSPPRSSWAETRHVDLAKGSGEEGRWQPGGSLSAGSARRAGRRARLLFCVWHW